MQVTAKTFSRICKSFSRRKYLVIDTETSGLAWHKDDKLFSIQIATHNQVYYFNYHPEHPHCLDRVTIMSLLDHFKGTIVAHNIKFDAFFLLKEGLDVRNVTWWDTMVAARVIQNDLPSLSLANLTGQKDDIKEYIEENKLFTWVESKYKKQRKKNLHFDQVPFDLISKYGITDAIITKNLMLDQINQDYDKGIMGNEMLLLKAVFDMELKGFKIDKDFINKACEYYENQKEHYRFWYKSYTGFKDPAQRKNLIFALEKDGRVLPLSAKGNPVTNSDILKEIEGDLAGTVLKYRDADKRLCTYYGSYLELESNNRVHASLKQHGTNTGRFSSSNPNLQNVHKKDTSDFPVRSCFVPDKDFSLLCIDYDAMELKMVYDIAGEQQICANINKGLDVHKALADSVQISRDQAKTINYGILYGMGIKKLAISLKMSLRQAKELRKAVFSKAPHLRTFINKVQEIASQKGYIYNIFGRKYWFNRDNSKDAISKIIQGGCADVVKFAMVELHEFLKPYKTHMLLTVHDEIVFQIHKDELWLSEKIKLIMENVYKGKYLKLTCSAQIKSRNWDK